MIIGVPLKGGQIGYASYGVCGAVGGAFIIDYCFVLSCHSSTFYTSFTYQHLFYLGGVAGVLAGGLGAAAVTV